MTIKQRLRVPPSPRGSDGRPRQPLEHPRLQRRRVEITREAGRRRLRVLLGALALAVLVAGVWGVARSPLLDVDRVNLAGAEHSGRPAVLAASGISPGRAMGGIDEATAAARIERLPWVAAAVVRREWPGTVHIAVVERRPVAVTRTFREQWGLVDAAGRVLAESPERPVGLPWVAGGAPAGPPASRVHPDLLKLLPVAQALPPGLAPRLGAIVALGPEVALFLAPYGLVRLGPAEGAADKLAVADAILARTDPATVAAIDARFPSTAVLTRA